MQYLRACLCVAAIALGLGCGGSQTRGASGSQPVQISGPPKPWAEMTGHERGQYMGDKVLPVMVDLFTAYDPNEFADFGCETCHGADAQSRAFDMPSPHLPLLYPTGTPEQHRMVQEHPNMVRFMFSKVVPTMQTLLGIEGYSEATHTGFSCYYCHPRAESEPTIPPSPEMP